MKREGNIKISSENMMPIIKKWLYSDKDIFLREIVANGIDAITKYKKLIGVGEAEDAGDELCVKITVDKDAGTLSVEDNGIGMTEDEVENYITRIAFSGAQDFLDKYEKAGGDGIIGHFGLGFYSCYMVSENVEIITKSWDGSPAVHWESDGNSTYTIEESDSEQRGTKVIMHIAPEEKEFLDESNIKKLVKKYCSFMPFNIYVNYKGDGEDKPLNTTEPLYAKNPKDCTDEDYKKFYTDTFMDYTDPVFWVHLNMDYPFKVKGILYFPKVRNTVQLERGQVKLYCNQVFIADNIKEVIPEYLMLLNGVIDCPDIPLNVSRSFLQNDKQVQKISKHIVKKVADKLNSLFKTDRPKYEECWTDVANFVKFGCIRDEDFYEKVKDVIIYRNLDDKYVNIPELLGEDKEKPEGEEGADEAAEAEGETAEDETAETDEDEDKAPVEKAKTIYYISDEKQQAQYVKLFRDEGLDAIKCDTFIDPTFMSFIEYKAPDKIKFARIDSDIDGALKSEADDTDSVIEEIFKSVLNNDQLTIKTEKLKNPDVPAMIITDEYMRRYAEMGQVYGMSEGDTRNTVIVNTSSPEIQKLKDLPEDKQETVVNYVYLLALSGFKALTPDESARFRDLCIQMLKVYVA
ncbi:MAG: molecular chaperone HtpG [Clostridia bacterium]|nr:molecular chaperone HtpG [Clostridia bacterium]